MESKSMRGSRAGLKATKSVEASDVEPQIIAEVAAAQAK